MKLTDKEKERLGEFLKWMDEQEVKISDARNYYIETHPILYRTKQFVNHAELIDLYQTHLKQKENE